MTIDGIPYYLKLDPATARVNGHLLELLTDTSIEQPDLYILTHEIISKYVLCAAGEICDDVIKKYKNTEYKYDEESKTLILKYNSNEPNYSIVIPHPYKLKYPFTHKYHFGRMINDLDQTGLTEEITQRNRFLKRNDWTDRLPLIRFGYYYNFEYEGTYNLILTDLQLGSSSRVWRYIDDIA